MHVAGSGKFSLASIPNSLANRRRNSMGHGRDRISDLPDDLLHCVLVYLQSAPAAARTSVLSRRWRRVWAHLPELVFGLHDVGLHPQDVDAALAAYSAPTVSSLDITVPDRCLHYTPSHSVDAWLSFASQRLMGTFSCTVDTRCPCNLGLSTVEIDLPPCERATSIVLSIKKSGLRLQPAGPFAALTYLKIESAFIEARELEALVSSHCPLLKDLTLFTRVLVSGSDVSIRSTSLERLNVHLEHTGRLKVAAPMLEVLTSCTMYGSVYISAPKLAEVNVSCLHRYQFADAGRHLRRLKIDKSTVVEMRRFDTVDELTLRADLTHEYSRFLDDINNLPRCEILRVSLSGYDHGFVPCMLHILRKANGIRKLVVGVCSLPEVFACSLTCPCRSPESSNADITFGSLEEIQIEELEFDDSFHGDVRLEFLKLLLSRCCAPNHTSLKITAGTTFELTKKAVEKIRNICPPNVRLTITWEFQWKVFRTNQIRTSIMCIQC